VNVRVEELDGVDEVAIAATPVEEAMPDV
jgi:hypothetical protein